MKISARYAKVVEWPEEDQPNRRKVLQTDSIQVLADFWDKNDLTDFDDELEEVDEPVFERQNAVKPAAGFREYAEIRAELRRDRKL